MIVYVYPKCTTCKAALQFLKERKAVFTEKDISIEPPSITELRKMLGFQNDDLKKLFNTSGLLYKEMQLKDKLPSFSVDQALTLLSKHGMLVKRPFVLGKDFGLVGFKEAEWSKKI